VIIFDTFQTPESHSVGCGTAKKKGANYLTCAKLFIRTTLPQHRSAKASAAWRGRKPIKNRLGLVAVRIPTVRADFSQNTGQSTCELNRWMPPGDIIPLPTTLSINPMAWVTRKRAGDGRVKLCPLCRRHTHWHCSRSPPETTVDGKKRFKKASR